MLRGQNTTGCAGVVIGDNENRTALHASAEEALRYAQRQFPRTASAEGVVAINVVTLQTVAG